MTRPSAPGYAPRFRWRWLGPRHWPFWLGLGLLILLGLLPRRLRWQLTRVILIWLMRRKPKRLHYVRINLDLAFPNWRVEEREATIHRCFRLLAMCSMDYALFWFAPGFWLDRRIRVEGWEHVTAAREEGRPVILFTGHTAALEAAGIAITRRIPASGLIRPMNHPIFDWLVARGRTRFLGRIHHRDTGMRPILRDLRAGSAFYYLPDEDLGKRETADWTFAPFFATPKATLTSLGRLTRAAGAAAIPCLACYDPERHVYRVRVDPPLADFPGDDGAADARAMNAALEALIRPDPSQYMWTHRLYRTRPPGAPKRYKQRARVQERDDDAG
ncbi:MAG: lipid A biosynthesis acyltransferase [Pseudomonadota bacterium]